MGLVVGVIVEVTVSLSAAAAEAAATAAVEAAAIATAEAAAEVAAETAAEVAVETAAEAAAEAVVTVSADATADVVAAATAETAEGVEIVAEIAEGASTSIKVVQAIGKLSKFIKEFFAIDAIFRTANAIIHKIEGCSTKFNKFKGYIDVLEEMQILMLGIKSWLEDHKNDYVDLEGISVPVDSGLLFEVMKPLIAGIGNLQRLATDVDRHNKDKRPITDTRLETLRLGLFKVNTTFEALATFMNKKKTEFHVLTSFPISKDKVDCWKEILQI